MSNNASKSMTRFSLLPTLLILGLIGVTAGWWSASRKAQREIIALQQETRSLQQENRSLRIELKRYQERVGQLSVVDTDKVQALFVRRSIDSPTNHWRFRVYLPDGHAYRLHVQTEDVAAELPVHEDELNGSKSESTEIFHTGKLLLDLSLAESSGQWLSVAINGKTRLRVAIPWLTPDLMVEFTDMEIQFPVYPSVIFRPTPKREWRIGEKAVIFSAHHVDENAENEGLVVWISSSAK